MKIECGQVYLDLKFGDYVVVTGYAPHHSIIGWRITYNIIMDYSGRTDVNKIKVSQYSFEREFEFICMIDKFDAKKMLECQLRYGYGL